MNDATYVPALVMWFAEVAPGSNEELYLVAENGKFSISSESGVCTMCSNFDVKLIANSMTELDELCRQDLVNLGML